MIRRPPRSTPLYSSAASDVYKRQDSYLVFVGAGGCTPQPQKSKSQESKWLFEELCMVKSGSQKVQASMVRRWLHELKPTNHLENLGPPRSLCLFPTNPKPEKIRCKRNTDHPTLPASACSSFLFYNLCGPDNAVSALPHSALAQCCLLYTSPSPRDRG